MSDEDPDLHTIFGTLTDHLTDNINLMSALCDFSEESHNSVEISLTIGPDAHADEIRTIIKNLENTVLFSLYEDFPGEDNGSYVAMTETYKHACSSSQDKHGYRIGLCKAIEVLESLLDSRKRGQLL